MYKLSIFYISYYYNSDNQYMYTCSYFLMNLPFLGTCNREIKWNMSAISAHIDLMGIMIT